MVKDCNNVDIQYCNKRDEEMGGAGAKEIHLISPSFFFSYFSDEVQ